MGSDVKTRAKVDRAVEAYLMLLWTVFVFVFVKVVVVWMSQAGRKVTVWAGNLDFKNHKAPHQTRGHFNLKALRARLSAQQQFAV